MDYVNYWLSAEPTRAAFVGLESFTHWFATKTLPETWDTQKVLDGTATVEETVRFIAVMMIVAHSFTYYIVNLGYTILSAVTTDEQKKRIRFQGTKKTPRDLLIKTIIYCTVLHIVSAVVMYKYAAGALYRSGFMGIKHGDSMLTSMPTFPKFMLSLVACLIMTDLTFYWGHRALHIGFLYRNIHKIHHEWTVTCAWACEYAHPVEFLMGNVLPVISGLLLFKMHPVLWGYWMILAIHGTCQGHSGYYPPFNANYWTGAHDFHHSNNSGCFGTLGTWDRICETNKAWLRFKSAKGKAREAIQFAHEKGTSHPDAGGVEEEGGGSNELADSPAALARLSASLARSDEGGEASSSSKKRTRSSSAKKKKK